MISFAVQYRRVVVTTKQYRNIPTFWRLAIERLLLCLRNILHQNQVRSFYIAPDTPCLFITTKSCSKNKLTNNIIYSKNKQEATARTSKKLQHHNVIALHRQQEHQHFQQHLINWSKHQLNGTDQAMFNVVSHPIFNTQHHHLVLCA